MALVVKASSFHSISTYSFGFKVVAITSSSSKIRFHVIEKYVPLVTVGAPLLSSSTWQTTVADYFN